MISSFYSPDSDIQNAYNAAKADEACAPDMGESLGEEWAEPHSWGARVNLTSNFVSMEQYTLEKFSSTQKGRSGLPSAH